MAQRGGPRAQWPGGRDLASAAQGRDLPSAPAILVLAGAYVSTDKQVAAKAANLVGLYLHSPEKALHVILDNYCTPHKKCDAWLARHPDAHFHFTPTSASWLNQVEIRFGILSRKAVPRSFRWLKPTGKLITEA
jgi:hypothetical protein